MNDSTTDLRRLVEGLYLKTLSKSVSWTYDQSTDACEAHLGNGYVQVVGETNSEGDYYCYIKVLNKEKQVVDSIYGGSLGESAPTNTGHKDYWKLIADLKSSAERSALGADEIISSILSELGIDSLDVDLPF